MSGDVEVGKCDVCGKKTQLNRKIYRYDIKCDCHSPHHFEIVRHCNDCIPKEPKTTKILNPKMTCTFDTDELDKLEK